MKSYYGMDPRTPVMPSTSDVAKRGSTEFTMMKNGGFNYLAYPFRKYKLNLNVSDSECSPIKQRVLNPTPSLYKEESKSDYSIPPSLSESISSTGTLEESSKKPEDIIADTILNQIPK